MQSNSKTVRNVPKDLGVFQTLVAGWEQVGSQSRSHTPARDIYSPSSASMSNVNETISIGLPLLSPNKILQSPNTAVLKEQFLRDLSPTPTPTTPIPTTPYSGAARTPTTPTYGGSSYRFAGVERLAQRQKIYEPQISSPESRKEYLSVSMACLLRLVRGLRTMTHLQLRLSTESPLNVMSYLFRVSLILLGILDSFQSHIEYLIRFLHSYRLMTVTCIDLLNDFHCHIRHDILYFTLYSITNKCFQILRH